MPVPVYSATETQEVGSQNVGSLKLRGHHAIPTTSAYPELDTQGYTVVKGVISKEKAQEYVDRAYKWLEGFGKGFKGDDRSTWHIDNLPEFSKGGLYNRHGSGHEQFAWDIRAEPGVIETFAKIWGTDELLVSFDGVNVSLPFPEEEMGDRAKAWPHVDQSPLRRFKHCIQGIMNLHENGPDDGGLAVLTGSFPLYNEFFETHEDEAPPEGWSWRDSHNFTESQLQWFYDRGCKWTKIEAGPGDVILWDSRCIHYGAAAHGDRPRVATYICYKPAKDITPEMLELRKECVKNYDNTSHDPLMFRATGTRIYGKLTEDEQEKPRELPVLSERAQQLAGVKAY
ncbi:hypothetical protein BCR39DRAFT_525560 [Naematelia encephala]|uniref:Phytanoyl-CoA dioxygenase n=1 Tax=Naematelia encephala TaxID=71784 RepID=A0A1Y2BBG3_9TREE|nr:hypothetical protein BCR39DRAFT_525560 [Naematelia encephala]